jgi:hypothetical protein
VEVISDLPLEFIALNTKGTLTKRRIQFQPLCGGHLLTIDRVSVAKTTKEVRHEFLFIH